MNKFYVELELKPRYKIHGTHRPATRFEPAEEPDIELLGVYLGETNVSGYLSSDEMGLAMDWCLEKALAEEVMK